VRIAVALLALALSACASGPGPRDRYARLLTPVANPSKVVAAELAFARAAQDKGQWTAFREFSTADAVMFVPEPVSAQEWLKKQADPAQAVTWQPHEVWSSCDGTLAVTKGAWQRPNGAFGYFTTVWQRQKKGEYQWVLDQGDVLKAPLAEPEFVKSHVAQCNADRETAATIFEHAVRTGRGASDDASLSYEWAVMADNSRRFVVRIAGEGGSEKALDIEVAAPAQ